MASTFDFLRTYIETLLDQTGFAEVPEETRAQYVPQFVAEAERRLGLALLPKLPEAGAKELAAMLESGSVAPEALQAFWRKNVPDFPEVVEETLRQFTAEMKSVAAGLGR